MISIPLTDMMTIIFVLVDDWYRIYGKQLLQGKPGAKPESTDSEVITLMMAQDYIPIPVKPSILLSFVPTTCPCSPGRSIKANSLAWPPGLALPLGTPS